MLLLRIFVRAYPYRSAIVLGCLLIGAVFEGLSFSSLLPLLSIAVKTAAQSASDSAPDSSLDSSLNPSAPSWLEQTLDTILVEMGIQPSIGALCLLIVAGMILKAGFVLLAQRQIGYTVAHVATDLRLSLLRTLLAARWEYYIRQPAGGFANAYATEAGRAAEGYLYTALMVSLGIQTVLYLSLAFAVSWTVTLGATVVGGLVALILSRLVQAARHAGAQQTRLLKLIVGRLTDVLYAVKPLKAMARETLIGPLLEQDTQQLNRALQREVLSKEMLRALQTPLIMIALTAGLYIALSSRALAFETVLILALLFERTLSSMNKVQRQYQYLASRESAYSSIQDTINRSRTARESSLGAHTPVLERAITLRQVSFAYADLPILKNVSLRIPARQFTTIVGPSGTGKTSTVDLIIGLIRPQAGEIWVDDVPLNTIDIHAWRQSVGYVPQETSLLHDSVLVNVTLGDPSLTTQDVEAALKAAGAWEFVSSLPDTLHTPVGERGSRLSGGQRQRIAIARALVHNPQLLILDEATTALDPDTEAAICATVQQLCRDTTVLAISHQPALLEAADHVYHLEGGAVQQIKPAHTPLPTHSSHVSLHTGIKTFS